MKSTSLFLAFGASLTFGVAPYCTVNSLGNWNCVYWTAQACAEAATRENAVCQAASSKSKEQPRSNLVAIPDYSTGQPRAQFDPFAARDQQQASEAQALANEEQALRNTQLQMQIWAMMTPEQRQAYMEKKQADQQAARKALTVLGIGALTVTAIVLLIAAGGG